LIPSNSFTLPHENPPTRPQTFGEQVDESTACAIMDRAVERGINFLKTVEL